MTIWIRRPVQTLASASEQLTRGFFSDAKTASKKCLGHVVAVERLDVLLARQGYCLLCLNDLQIIGDASGETVARLHKLLGRQIACARCHLQLFGGGLEIQERVLHIVV